jgi:hypothetical protein
VTNVHVDKVVYKNVRVNNAVTTVNHETFVRGKPADARVNENPFLTEKVHVGRPPIKPEKSSAMPVVREVPQTKRPPEPVKRVNVRELKEQRPMVKSKEASVFAPETRPREMPVKEGEAKPTLRKTERAKELRQPPKRTEETRTSVPAEKLVSQPGPTETNVQAPKEPKKSERTRQPEPAPTKVQQQKQQVPADKESGQPGPSEPAVKTQKETKKSERTLDSTRQRKPAPAEIQEQKPRPPADKGRSQPAPSEPAVRTRGETRAPERGSDKNIETGSPEKVMQQPRPPERVQPKTKEVIPPEKGMPQTPEIKAPEKSTERPRAPRNREKGA